MKTGFQATAGEGVRVGDGRPARVIMWKKVGDLVLYLTACSLLGSGLLLAYRLPPAHGEPYRDVFLGLDRHGWGEIHEWLGYLIIAIGAIYLWLNRQWLLNVAASKRGWRLAAGLMVGIALVVSFLLLPVDQTVQLRGRVPRIENSPTSQSRSGE